MSVADFPVLTTLDDLWAKYDDTPAYLLNARRYARHAIEEAIRAEAGGELLARLKDAEERAAHWQGNHKQQVELKRKSHEMVLALREALETARLALVAVGQSDADGNAIAVRAGTIAGQMSRVLADTAPAAAAEVARIEKPWREALHGLLVAPHPLAHEGRPCLCAIHEDARALLDKEKE